MSDDFIDYTGKKLKYSDRNSSHYALVSKEEFSLIKECLREAYADPETKIRKLFTDLAENRIFTKNMHIEFIDFIFSNKYEKLVFVYSENFLHFEMTHPKKYFNEDILDHFYNELLKSGIVERLIEKNYSSFKNPHTGATRAALNRISYMFSDDVERVWRLFLMNFEDENLTNKTIYFMNKFDLTFEALKEITSNEIPNTFYYRDYDNAKVINKHIETYISKIKGLSAEDFLLKLEDDE